MINWIAHGHEARRLCRTALWNGSLNMIKSRLNSESLGQMKWHLAGITIWVISRGIKQPCLVLKTCNLPSLRPAPSHQTHYFLSPGSHQPCQPVPETASFTLQKRQGGHRAVKQFSGYVQSWDFNLEFWLSAFSFSLKSASPIKTQSALGRGTWKPDFHHVFYDDCDNRCWEREEGTNSALFGTPRKCGVGITEVPKS